MSIDVTAAAASSDLAFTSVSVSGGQVQLILQTLPNQAVDILVSTDLVNWTRLAAGLPNDRTMIVVDPYAPSPARFYRARLSSQDR